MPPPPPPPPAPNMKPAAPPAASKSSSGGGDGRGLLLDSIRQGKTLKKTQINDRSAPIVQTSKSSPALAAESRGGGGTGSSGARGQGLTAPPGLAGLFAGGMPKLKPVGGSKTPTHQSPQKLSPPDPPPSSQKPTMSSLSQYAPEEPPPQERKLSIGKPSVAPKPPALHSKGPRPNPPPKLPSLVMPQPPPMIGGDEEESPSPPPGVNRAQSMRLPRSTSPTQTRGVPIEYRTMGRAAAKNITPQPPPPPRNFQNGSQRPRNAPMRPPSARPPPPPNKIPPAHPPPPPPPPLNNSHPPPPPPHRGMATPLPVAINGNLGPPPPPTRNSSIRNIVAPPPVNSTSNIATGVDLEARFRHLFVPIENLPKPEQFTGFTKTYPSKIAQSQKRQPAPQPPTQVQLGHKMWVNNTSAC